MIKKNFVIKNKLGIHARPAALFVQLASSFESDIIIEKDGQKVNGKSIMGIMMLAAEYGSTLIISANGKDEEAAISAIEKLIESKFDEE